MPLHGLDPVHDLIRRAAGRVSYVRALERKGDKETDQAAHITNEPDDPVLQLYVDEVAGDNAGRAEQIIEVLTQQLEAYADLPEALVLRVYIYGPKGSRLGSFTVRSTPQRDPIGALAPAEPALVPRLELTSIDDLVTQRIAYTLSLQQQHTQTVQSNYQVLFNVLEHALSKVAGLMEQRAARAERHALDLIEKRIAEKRMQLELSAGERKKEGELAVKEKAIETAGGVVEKILGGVLGSFGFDAAAAGQLGGLLRLLETDPELKDALADPSVVAAFRDPEVRGLVKGMLHSFKTGTVSEAGEPTQEAR